MIKDVQKIQYTSQSVVKDITINPIEAAKTFVIGQYTGTLKTLIIYL